MILRERDVTEERLMRMESALEDLALAVVVLGEDDLPAAGELLEKVEAVAADAKELDEADLAEMCGAVTSGIEKLILAELEEPQNFISLLPEVVSAMQEIFRRRAQKGSGGFAPEELKNRLAQAAGASLEQVQAPPPEKKEKTLPLDLDKDLAMNFVSEALDLLQEIEVAILNVEHDPEDPEAINAIFRPFHTIKGVSGFLNLGDINHLAHDVENLLDGARSGDLAMEGTVVDLILDAVDLLRVMISDVSTEINTGQPTGADYGLGAFLNRIELVKEAALKRQTGEGLLLGQIMLAKGELNPQQLNDSLATHRMGGQPLGSVLIEEHVAPAKAVARSLRDQRGAKGEVQAIKVDTLKLDNMVDMVGELVIALSLVNQNPRLIEFKDQKLDRDLGQLGRITSELQKTAMSLRLVPIKQTFQRMMRLVRDLSKKSGKKVELIMEGQDTEIDRTMVEAIYDPLVHMLRNSIDHGLEGPHDRVQAGKPEAGMIILKAFHQGGRIVIEIEDDGRGLPTDKILVKAIDKGLVELGADLSQNEIHQLILQPGFSTADKVTDISGRGVGMDVVKMAVETLRGSMEIASQEGRFTRFTIRLPLTMAIIEGIIVGAGAERFIFPALVVEEVLMLEPGSISTVSGKSGEMAMIRGRLLPLVRLARLFGCGRGNDEGIAIVVESEGRRKAVLVDQILGKQEVVIKSLGAGLKNLPGLAGGAILGDGRVGLIVDVKGLFQVVEGPGRGFHRRKAREETAVEV